MRSSAAASRPLGDRARDFTLRAYLNTGVSDPAARSVRVAGPVIARPRRSQKWRSSSSPKGLSRAPASLWRCKSASLTLALLTHRLGRPPGNVYNENGRRIMSPAQDERGRWSLGPPGALVLLVACVLAVALFNRPAQQPAFDRRAAEPRKLRFSVLRRPRIRRNLPGRASRSERSGTKRGSGWSDSRWKTATSTAGECWRQCAKCRGTCWSPRNSGTRPTPTTRSRSATAKPSPSRTSSRS